MVDRTRWSDLEARSPPLVTTVTHESPKGIVTTDISVMTGVWPFPSKYNYSESLVQESYILHQETLKTIICLWFWNSEQIIHVCRMSAHILLCNILYITQGQDQFVLGGGAPRWTHPRWTIIAAHWLHVTLQQLLLDAWNSNFIVGAMWCMWTVFHCPTALSGGGGTKRAR